MSETVGIMETQRPPEQITPPELASAIRQSLGEINAEHTQPEEQVAKVAVKTGLMKDLYENAMKPFAKSQLEIQWKNVKALGAAALSLIPLLGDAGAVVSVGEEAATVVKIGGEAGTISKVGKAVEAGKFYKTARRVGLSGNIPIAKENFVQALRAVPNRASITEAAKVAWKARKAESAVKSAALKELGKRVAINGAEAAVKTTSELKNTEGNSTLGKVAKFIDPFPDVPMPVVLGAGLVDFVLPGANIVSSVWQIGANYIHEVKDTMRFGKDMSEIIARHSKDKIQVMKTPKVANAALAFA